MCMKISLDCGVNTEELISELREYGVSVKLDYSKDITMQILTIDASQSNICSSDFSKIAEKTIINYKELFKSNIHWRYGLDGVLQLVLLNVISDIMRGFE